MNVRTTIPYFYADNYLHDQIKIKTIKIILHYVSDSLVGVDVVSLLQPHPLLLLLRQVEATRAGQTGHVPVKHVPQDLGEEGEPVHVQHPQAVLDIVHLQPGVYKVSYKGKFNKSVGKEYQVMNRGREYHGCGEEYNVEKKGKQYHLSYNIKAIMRNIKKWDKGTRTKILEKNLIF